jgi:hypothetical protein
MIGFAIDQPGHGFQVSGFRCQVSGVSVAAGMKNSQFNPQISQITQIKINR